MLVRVSVALGPECLLTRDARRAILERDHDHLTLPQPAPWRQRAPNRALGLPGREGGVSPILSPGQPLLLCRKGPERRPRRAGGDLRL